MSGSIARRTIVAMGKADPGDLPSEQVYRAFVGDFKGAWTAVEQVRPNGRGNFIFALLAMDFLEWCGQVTKEHPIARTAFIDTLSAADPLYYAQLPTEWPGEKLTTVFPFPTGRELLWVVFNMVRHGLAHRYVQADVDLTDVRLRVQVTGPDRPMYTAGSPRPSDHLVPVKRHGKLGPLDTTTSGHDVVIMRLHPDVLFVDLRAAADAAAVVTLPPVSWTRRKFDASAADLLRLPGAPPPLRS